MPTIFVRQEAKEAKEKKEAKEAAAAKKEGAAAAALAAAAAAFEGAGMAETWPPPSVKEKAMKLRARKRPERKGRRGTPDSGTEPWPSASCACHRQQPSAISRAL